MKNKKSIISIITFIIFLIILIIILKNENTFIDKYIINIFKSKNETITNIMKIITFFGSAYIIIPLTIILLLTLKNKKNKILIVNNLIIVTLINQILKYTFQRTRPINQIVIEKGYSFPSGHSMVSMAFYGLLIYLLMKSNNKYKTPLIILLSILIILIGISRIYLNVHYPTDVIAGICISISYLMIFIQITKPIIN